MTLKLNVSDRKKGNFHCALNFNF